MVIASLKFSFFDELRTMNERSIMDLLIPEEEGQITDEKSLAKLLKIAQDRSHALRLLDGTNRDVFVEHSYDNDTLALIDNALKHGYSISKADFRMDGSRGNCLDYTLRGPGLTTINSKRGLEGVSGSRDDQSGDALLSKQGKVEGANGSYVWNRDAIIAALQCTTEARDFQLLFVGALRSGYFDALKEMDENDILDLLAQDDKKTNITKLLEVARDQRDQHERPKKKKRREESGIGFEEREPWGYTAGMLEMKQRIALLESQTSTKDATIVELEAQLVAREATIANLLAQASDMIATAKTNSETMRALGAALAAGLPAAAAAAAA